MKDIATKGIMFAALAFLVTGLSVPAAAQLPGNPSQFCKQEIEPEFQSIGLTLPHSTCVTLLTGADDGNVSLCKFMTDIGVNPSYGQCVSGKISATTLYQEFYNYLIDNNAPSNVIEAFVGFGLVWEEITGRSLGVDFGPTGTSLLVFASLLAGWIVVKRYRGKVRSAQYGC